jgi:3-hydroxyacyl-CoA dehydrogenase
VIWSPDEMFSVGADLQAMLPAFVVAGIGAVEGARRAAERDAQDPLRQRAGGVRRARHGAGRRLRAGRVLGQARGGDGKLHRPGRSRRGPDARRGRPDLHRAPRGGERIGFSTGTDLLPFLTEGFTAAAMAKVGTGALDSKKLGYLLDSDVIVPNKDELLYVALQQAKAMADAGYRAPLRRTFRVAGRSGKPRRSRGSW